MNLNWNETFLDAEAHAYDSSDDSASSSMIHPILKMTPVPSL